MSLMFNSDGSLVAPKKVKRDHIPLMLALDEIPFGVGKKLLVDFCRGIENSKTLRLKFDSYIHFGDLGGYSAEELYSLIDYLIKKDFITNKKENFYTVLELTEKGRQELENPEEIILVSELNNYESEALEINNPFDKDIEISKDDKNLFLALNDLFPHFNEAQKKAVISNEKKILCVAGAGSGKTSVLTKRIEFLVKYKSVNPNKILAITFTRKARREMQERLASTLPGISLNIETFNSFSEKFLQKYGDKNQRMIAFKEQFILLNKVLQKHSHSRDSIVKEYFTIRQRMNKDDKSLFFSFNYDFQSLIDKIKITNTPIEEIRKTIASNKHSSLANLLLNMAEDYLNLLKKNNYRTFSDQILQTINLFEKVPELIPEFEHVLVDEYQDVNDTQIKFLDLLNAKNLFAVGDPRQSIYGWRGSKLSHILEFPNSGDQIIPINTNYRSDKKIIDLCNQISKKTGYGSMTSASESEGIVKINNFRSEADQAAKIANEIKNYEGNKKEIFVLSRTNKGLKQLSQELNKLQINYLLRTEEINKPSLETVDNQVTLATIHAIKGLEAKRVYLINANTSNFPCKATDHPVMEMFNLLQDYDSYAEELRVLYVALSRAEKELFISYTGSLSHFISEDFIPTKNNDKTKAKSQLTDMIGADSKLRNWRNKLARTKGCPAYIIFNDKTLSSILEINPQTIDDLYSVPGLGKYKIQEFGEELIMQIKKL